MAIGTYGASLAVYDGGIIITGLINCGFLVSVDSGSPAKLSGENTSSTAGLIRSNEISSF